MSAIIESVYDSVEMVTESTKDGKKYHYITGIFAQGNVVNKNKRIYPNAVLDESMDNYIRDYVSQSRAVGELAHPSHNNIDLDRISHLVTEMRKSGSDYHGKARVLNTPTGKIVQALLEGGVKLGVSTRANGNVNVNSQGINEVAPGLDMKAVDIVFNPSAPAALVDSLMESEQLVVDALSEDMMLVESIRKDIRKTSSRSLQEAKILAFHQIMNSLRG